MKDKLTSIYELKTQKCSFYISRYYCQNFNVFYMDLHKHSAFEIMYVAKGVCSVSYNLNGKSYSTALKQGEFIFIDCNIPHMLEVNKKSPCRILNLEIELIKSSKTIPSISQVFDTYPSFMQFLERKKPVIIFRDIYESDSLQEIMYNIHSYVENMPAYCVNTAENLLVNLEILKLLTLISHKHLTSPEHMVGLYYIKKAKEYIDKNFDYSIYINDIAAYVGISSAYLQRLFSKQLEMTIMDYIIQKRIHKSILLLKYTNSPIIDIAIDCGFNSRQHFTYTFKKQLNMSPNEFRKIKDTYQIPFTVTLEI